MVYGVSASSRNESRYFAVVAQSERQALSFVKEAVGAGFKVRAEDIQDMLVSQYAQLAELASV